MKEAREQYVPVYVTLPAKFTSPVSGLANQVNTDRAQLAYFGSKSQEISDKLWLQWNDFLGRARARHSSPAQPSEGGGS